MSKEEPNDDPSNFLVSQEPVVAHQSKAALFSRPGSATVEEVMAELPRSYGKPVLFAIARDPKTVFAYWDINWPQIFGDSPPEDRKVHLRVHAADGVVESSAAVEPSAANSYLRVSKSRANYTIEIGYYQPGRVWKSVATAEVVTTPPDAQADRGTLDIATVPYHLSFQRLVELFAESEEVGTPLVDRLAGLQKRAVSDDPADALSETEAKLIDALKITIVELVEARRQFGEGVTDERLRDSALEKLLGLGGTSPAEGLGGSSRA